MLCWRRCIRSGVDGVDSSSCGCGRSRISICRSRCVDGDIGSRSGGIRIDNIGISTSTGSIIGSSGNSIIRCSINIS